MGVGQLMTNGLLSEVRGRFAHVEECPFAGPRIYFENAGGALRLKSVIETSTAFAGHPDNQGRDNPASARLMAVIARGREDMRLSMPITRRMLTSVASLRMGAAGRHDTYGSARAAQPGES